MNRAQETIQRIHQEIGTSDSEIADILDVSREHINRIKQGKVTASETLADNLTRLLALMHTRGYQPVRKHYTFRKRKPIPRPRPESYPPVSIEQPREPVQRSTPYPATGVYGDPY
jgi:DNA-binding XRE family transcriptional regulator